MAISLGAIRESQGMCSKGWRRKTDHREAGRGGGGAYKRHLRVTFRNTSHLFSFFFFLNFLHTLQGM